MLVVLGSVLISYRDQIISGIASSRSFVSDLFVQGKGSQVTVRSSYGVSLSYDQRQFYTSGISSEDGNAYSGSELATQRPYTVLRLVPNLNSTNVNDRTTSSFTVTIRPGRLGVKETLNSIALQSAGLDASKLTQTGTESVVIGGQAFEKTSWKSKTTSLLASSVAARFVTYGAEVRGSVVTIVIPLGVTDGSGLLYREVLESISFDTKVSAVKVFEAGSLQKQAASLSLLDQIMHTSIAAAASGANLTGSEKVAALYSPAVIKIYNSYCLDILVDGKSYLKDVCDSEAGSGFFVSNDGYIGTNGHVASRTPLDLVISDAISVYSTKGDPKNFNYLLSLTKLTREDIPDEATNSQKLAIMVDAMYTISPDRISVTNGIQNLLVQVTAKNPDIAALLDASKARQPYIGDKSVLTAKVIAADYRATDGYDGFRASDVAIIKVEGKNFPVVKLGTIDSVRQGADLSILGYPSNASNNGIVDSNSSKATLTTGKVSSKKNAANSDKKLIETDTTIGHGNSGGPALDDDGNVVGIATYTADGSGDGDGVFNYIRDIKDLTDLAAANKITFNTNSTTQREWETGIGYFYTAHYSKALQNFRTVQTLYPNNSRVEEFIGASEKRIANGEDVSDFPFIQVIVASSIFIVGTIISIVLIVRHHKKHKIYQTGVAQGSVLPGGHATKTQTVFVSTNKIRVDSPLPLSTAPRGAVIHPEGHEEDIK